LGVNDTGLVPSASQEITVAIFGSWRDRQEIESKLADPDSQNFFDGRTLINKARGKVVHEIDVRDRDPGLVASVVSCGAGRLGEKDIEAINEHSHYIVLTGPVSDCVNHSKSQTEAALDMFNTAAALVQDLQGSAVHVATAGITHTLESWVAMNNECTDSAKVNAFVQRIGGSGIFFSCGMHAFGCADACLVDNLPSAEGSKVLFEFLLHTLSNKLEPQQAPFIFEPQSLPVSGGFRVTSGKCTEWDEKSSLYNRFGVWNLTRV